MGNKGQGAGFHSTDMQKRYLLLIFIFLSSFLSVRIVFAAGQRESRLDTVDLLIEEKKYDQALAILAEIIKSNPNQEAAVNKRIAVILEVKEQFNIKLQELVEVIEEAEDYEKILHLADNLGDLYPDPNKEMSSVILNAKQEASRVGNRNHFNTGMDEAAGMLAERQWKQALQRYLALLAEDQYFDLHREEYGNTDLGNIVTNIVSSAWEQILLALSEFDSYSRAVTEAWQQLTSESDVPPFSEQLALTDAIVSGFSSLDKLAQDIDAAALELATQSEQLRSREAYLDASNHVQYLYLLAAGRDRSRTEEGLSAVLKKMVIYLNGLYLSDSRTELEKYFLSGTRFLAAGDYITAREAMRRGLDLSRLIIRFAFYYDEQRSLGDDFDVTLREVGNMAGSGENFTLAVVDARSVLAYLGLIEEQEKLPDLRNTVVVPGEEQIESFTSGIMENLANLKDVLLEWQGAANELNVWESAEPQITRRDSILRIARTLSAEYMEEFLRIVGLVMSGYTEKLAEEINLLESGEIVEQATIEGNLTKDVRFYPDKRLLALEAIEQMMRELRHNVTRLAGVWSENENLLNASTMLLNRRQDLQQFDNNLGDHLAIINEAVATAKKNIFESRKLSQEGEIYYSEAERAFRRRDFREARRKISDAGNRFFESLKLREDAGVRRQREVDLLALDERIVNAENDIVIAEIREALTVVERLYSQGVYDEAEELLLESKNRWEEVKGRQVNPEIELWLGYVRTARKIISERVIEETDPLYKDMSQYSNFAKQSYNEGLALAKQGDTPGASRAFEEAHDKNLHILKSFPYNEDARVLELLILRETKPETFNEEIENLLQAALKKLNSSDSGEKQDGFSALKDLLKIVPDNARVKQALARAENQVVRGGSQRSQQDIALAQERALEARKYIESQNPDTYPAAQALLNEAINLNPANTLAKQLLDELGRLQGSQGTALLSQRAQELYDQALEYLVGNAPEAALALVEEAYRVDPRSRNSRRMRELEQTVRARL